MTWDKVYPLMLEGYRFHIEEVDKHFGKIIKFGFDKDKPNPKDVCCFIYRPYLLRDDWEIIND